MSANFDDFKRCYQHIIESEDEIVFADLVNKLYQYSFINYNDDANFIMFQKEFLAFKSFFGMLDVEFVYNKELGVAGIKIENPNYEYTAFETKIIIILRIIFEEKCLFFNKINDVEILYEDFITILFSYGLFDDIKQRSFDKRVEACFSKLKDHNLIKYNKTKFNYQTNITIRKAFRVMFDEKEYEFLKNSINDWRKDNNENK